MEAFRYKAMNAQGRVLHGKIDAVNPADLETRLSRLGLDLVNFKELKSKQRNITGHGIKRTDLITFCFHLEQLVHAGVPILEGLADLRDSVDNKHLREVTAAMIEAIEGGRNLSGSMEEFPSVFNSVFINLIKAGEQSGQLTVVLHKISENLKWQDEQAAQTKKLLMYPSIVSVLVAGVLFFLMLYVVPQLISFLATMGQELPMQTRALIATSAFFRSYWYLILAAPVLAGFATATAIQTNPDFALKVDRWKLEFPIVGPIFKKIIVTRVCNIFSIMYSSGITV
ncbi:MAG: type IV pilus assembly protein PilC, partial [Gammaproteobacteria bacterium]